MDKKSTHIQCPAQQGLAWEAPDVTHQCPQKEMVSEVTCGPHTSVTGLVAFAMGATGCPAVFQCRCQSMRHTEGEGVGLRT
jgi:hypothetical protein